MSSTFDNLYQTSADFGLWKTRILFYIAVFIAIFLFISSINLYFTTQSTFIKTTATIISINNVQTYLSNKIPNYIYSLTISYKVDKEQNNRTANITYNTIAEPLNKNSIIHIEYDINNPSFVTTNSNYTKKDAMILSLFGLFLILITGISYWLSKRFKFFAAAEGVSTFANVVSAPFR